MSSIACPNCNQLNRSTSRFCASCGEALPSGVIPAANISGRVQKLKDGFFLEGRYRIISELGRGGFGAVYPALGQALEGHGYSYQIVTYSAPWSRPIPDRYPGRGSGGD